MQNAPLVSVIVPTYNSKSEELERTINSILNQDYTNIEIIVVDDGSRNPFSGIKDRFKIERRIQWLEMSENMGVAVARNAGIQQASGDYIAFLDAGDWWEPNKIRLQVKLFESLSSDYGLVYCGAFVHNPNGMVYKSFPKFSGNIYKHLLVSQVITGSCSSVLMPRHVLDKVGDFFEQYDLPEDRELWMRISKNYEVSYVNQCLVHLNVCPCSRSTNPEVKSITYRRLLRLYEKDLIKYGVKSKAWAHCKLVIGQKYLRKRNIIKAFTYFADALFTHPSIHVTKGLIISLFPFILRLKHLRLK
ncbi:MAG: glycosyltransferase family 2 protein [Candidatus Marinimicrobia bacterium]|nr:glycosyltransferase family 2 protein [Candidatus Neomarinimicrobiota bacterium]